MILDKNNIFSTAQSVTSTTSATDVLDLGEGDPGPAEGISLFVNVQEPYTGSGTMVVELKTSPALTSTGTLQGGGTTIATYPLESQALIQGGKVLAARLPQGLSRYCALNYQVAGSLSTGTITAGLVMDV